MNDLNKTIIEETFAHAYDRNTFRRFIRELLSGIEDRDLNGGNHRIAEQFVDYIDSYRRIGKYTYFLPCTSYNGVTYSPTIIIGDNCWIGIRNSFAAIERIEIGKNVLFAGYVHITDHSHGYEDITQPILKQKLISKGPVVIEDDCWIGFGSEILSGVHIGKHSIIAAHAVVTKNVPAYSIAAGNPARIVKKYNFETKKWEKI